MDAQLIQDTYSKISVEELLDIISHRSRYTEVAIDLANAELDKRNVPHEERRKYGELQAEFESLYPSYNITEDLAFAQKLFFYVLWPPRIGGFPLSGAVRSGFSEKGHILKVWQSNYYAVLGFAGFMIALSLGTQSIIALVLVWTLWFLLIYLVDRLYNLRRQRRKLQRLAKEGKLDLEW